MGTQSQRGTVIEVSPSQRFAIVRTDHGDYIEVTLDIRVGKGGWPLPGEYWLLSRVFGEWVFSMLLRGGDAPLITALRDGESDLTVQILDALVSLGLVQDRNQLLDSGDPFDLESNLLPEDFEDLSDPPPDVPDSDRDGDDPPSEPDEPRSIYSDLWVSSFNVEGLVRGNKGVGADLRRLASSRAMVIGVQEIMGDRDSVVDMMDAQGFGCFRQGGGPDEAGSEWLATFWRKRDVKFLSGRMVRLTDRPTPGEGIPRWAQVVRLQHRHSGVRFSLINSHFSPPARWPGGFYLQQVSGTADLIEECRDFGPSFITVDTNTNHRDPADRGQAGWPHEAFAVHDAFPNYRYLDPPSNYGTHGHSCIDYVWRGPASPRQARYAEQKILRGYGSDHRPILVRVQMRRKDSGADE